MIVSFNDKSVKTIAAPLGDGMAVVWISARSNAPAPVVTLGRSTRLGIGMPLLK